MTHPTSRIERIEVQSTRGPYEVLVGDGLLDQLPALPAGATHASAGGAEGPRLLQAVISNTTVAPLYARSLARRLGLPPPLELPDGEAYKRWPQVEAVAGWMLASGLHRGSTVAAVGGGVVTDLVGFAASVFMRGMRWIAMPTTLLGMVDASVGGKTGINLEQGKNLVGSFWPPRLVIADVGTLATLDRRELVAGLAEVIKTAWIADRDLLASVARAAQSLSGSGMTAPRDPAETSWTELVARSIRIKADVVAADEHERGRRQCLNLGHTVGHALESVTAYERLLHGEAVAWGLRVEARIAVRRGILSPRSEVQINDAVASLGPLPTIDDLDPDQVVEHLARDKKRDDLGVAWALPTDGGVSLGERISAREVLRALADLRFQG